MATDHFSLTIPVDASCVPKQLSSVFDVQHLYTEEHSVLGLSRNNWFKFMATKVVHEYGLNYLAYFERPVTVLTPSQASLAISDLETFLTSIKSAPGKFIELSGQTMFSESDIATFTESYTISRNPRENSDDGDDILYFIAFLKSHAAVLTEAAQKGSYVIYGQST